MVLFPKFKICVSCFGYNVLGMSYLIPFNNVDTKDFLFKTPPKEFLTFGNYGLFTFSW